MVRHTSSVIAATNGVVPVGDLSEAAGVSSTHLGQRFKELIGVTPKRLARTHRFTATVFSIDPAGPIDWADLASSAGYFDQAHFGHEFREFTGLTPTCLYCQQVPQKPGNARKHQTLVCVIASSTPPISCSIRRVCGPSA